ncbi:50S ribosomal protein L10 [Candidatus Woesearchaeota archaeon]|nr:50S ribosomal protein L10 [Candidatus Woesearchaeota archaeon]
MKPKPHINPEKVEQLNKALTLINNNPIIGVVNMQNLPARQLQIMKEQLRDKVTLFMTKRRLLRIAFQKSDKKGLDALEDYLQGMPALLVTKDNPFTLYKAIKKNKSPAPAKAGQVATKDIIVKAGPTPFAPGPIIGELGSIGLKAGIDGGKVAIKEDKVVCKEGEVISEELASILTRLDINPMEIGLDLLGVYENGTLYPKKLLDIDEEEFLDDLKRAGANALALAMETGIPTTETTQALLVKAARESMALASSQDILTKDTVGTMLAKAQSQANILKKE